MRNREIAPNSSKENTRNNNFPNWLKVLILLNPHLTEKSPLDFSNITELHKRISEDATELSNILGRLLK